MNLKKLKLKNIEVERIHEQSFYLVDDHRPFMINLQILKYYFSGISNDSRRIQALWNKEIEQFTMKHLIPRLSNDVIREIHLAGAPISSVTLGTALQAEEIYQDNDLFPTHNQFVKNIEHFISNLTLLQDTKIEGEVLKLFATISNSLSESDSPSGNLTIQDRYFLIFLFLKNSSTINRLNIKTIFNGIISDNIINLLFNATMKYDELCFENIIGLILYDHILFEDPLDNNGLEIKLLDIEKARQLMEFICGIRNNDLIGGFDDNQSFKVFQFYNIMFARDTFHENCLHLWQTLIIKNNNINVGNIIAEIKRTAFISETIHRKHKYIDHYEKIYFESK